EHRAGRPGQVPIEPVQDGPSPTRLVPANLRPVDLVGHDEPVEAGLRRAQGAPAAHHLAYRLVSPEAEIEVFLLRRAPAGDAGDYAEALAPAGDFEAGNGTGERSFGDQAAVNHPTAQCPRRVPAAAHRSARNRARWPTL